MGSLNGQPGRSSRHPDAVVRLARYLHSWGLTHGPALARATYHLIREARRAGCEDPASQMRYAMQAVDRWIDELAAAGPGADASGRRFAVVARMKEALSKHPQAFMAAEAPEAFVAMLHEPVPELTPATNHSAIKPQALGRVPRLFRAGFWLRLVRRAEAPKSPI
jgi:hypothetical protein